MESVNLKSIIWGILSINLPIFSPNPCNLWFSPSV